MFSHFNNLKQLITYFSTEEVCREYLEKIRWNGEPSCPHCGCQRAYRYKDGRNFRCSSKTCRKDFSVTVGLIFENSKVPLTTWFAAVYLVTAHKKGISSCQLARDLGVSQKTAWFMNHRIREAFGAEINEELDGIVEMDETYVGGKWTNKHKRKRAEIKRSNLDKKIPVMGILQRDGKASLKVIKPLDTFQELIAERVKASAVVVTDAHPSHTGIDDVYKGHILINHSNDEYVNGEYHTNTVEGFFSMLKRGIYGIYHQVSPKHLHRYCEEFAYRYNYRKERDSERFVRTLGHTKGRLKYNDLIGNPKKPTKKSAA